MIPILSIMLSTTAPHALAEPDVPKSAQPANYPNLQFAEVAGRKLLLDLVVPASAEKPPLVVIIHGGGWRSGRRNEESGDAVANALVAHGFATARIDYRKSDEAVFPAQLFDCKGAVRWLKAHADRYGYDPQRVALFGQSAGGHLTVLIATTPNDAKLEGDVGGHLDHSSTVQAVVDLYGPTDFIQRAKDQPEETDNPTGKVFQLLGGPVSKNVELAKEASGLYHVKPGAPPLLILHGTRDPKVLLNQSERLLEAYKKVGSEATLHLVQGAGHGGPEFDEPEPLSWITDFLGAQLKTSKTQATQR